MRPAPQAPRGIQEKYGEPSSAEMAETPRRVNNYPSDAPFSCFVRLLFSSRLGGGWFRNALANTPLLWQVRAMEQNRRTESFTTEARSLSAQIADMVERAYAAGREAGLAEATERVLAAVRGVSVPEGNVERKENEGASIGENETHPNSAEARRFPYGAVANAFRMALRQNSFIGAKREVLIGKVSDILGEDVSDMNHIDTIKRLKKKRELVVENGLYKAGPGLSRNETKEASGGDAADASQEEFRGL